MREVILDGALEVRTVESPSEIDRLRWFQTLRYFETGVTDELPTALPADPAVDHSTYFGLFGADGRVQASARLIEPTCPLPFLAYHPIFPGVDDRLAEGGIAEISRMAVARNAPHHQALGLLSRELFRFCLRHPDYNAMVASVAPALARIIDKVLGVPVEVIGPELPSSGPFNGPGVPILIDTVRYLTEPRFRAHKRWQFFTEGLTIDLTGERLRVWSDTA